MKVFLSHTSSDKDLVELISRKLNHDAWYDAVDIENGDRIPEKISEGLRLATHYVLFWSEKACESKWVNAEMNAAFIQTMEDQCKLMIFTLDETPLPELLQPYKYDYINKQDINVASDIVVKKIMAEEGVVSRLSGFVNRTKELGDIEDAVRDGYKLIILNGILGIGKSMLAKKAINFLYQNRAQKSIEIDFNTIPGIAELAIEMSNKTKQKLRNDNLSQDDQKENIQFFLEYISANNIILILKDIKNWLNEDGTINNNLLFVTNLVVNTKMFSYVTIMTSSRYVEIPYDYYKNTFQLRINGMDDKHISDIIRNNLPSTVKYDERKTYDFAKRLYGYPLGAKLGAYRIANQGYDYYLQQPDKIQKLKISLAKELISYAELSPMCLEYLKIIAICKSRLRNDEYMVIFPEFSDNIAQLSEEAFFAGILIYSEGCYKLERLVEDFFYDLAFNDSKCKEHCCRLESYLLKKIEKQDLDYMRLVQLTIHILTLNGHIDKARKIRCELTATMADSMWDLYNHSEYDEANKVAEQLIQFDSENIEARYVKALCLIRFDECDEAQNLISELIQEDNDNEARYYNALGRIKKVQGLYQESIELFKISILKRKRYLSPYRELAECYLLMDNIADAYNAINRAKQIDESNIFVILLEARILQKEDRAEKAIELLENQSLIERKPAQIYFRKGRAYDQLGEKEQAMQCYMEALYHDPKTYDAQLCLLSHKIIDDPQNAKKEIDELRDKLRGKRKYILTNIEARFVGYQNHEEERAIELLDGVPRKYRDRQWYAVKIQLFENLIEKNECAQRVMLSNAYRAELEKLYNTIKDKYGDITFRDVDLLPDA